MTDDYRSTPAPERDAQAPSPFDEPTEAIETGATETSGDARGGRGAQSGRDARAGRERPDSSRPRAQTPSMRSRRVSGPAGSAPARRVVDTDDDVFADVPPAPADRARTPAASHPADSPETESPDAETAEAGSTQAASTEADSRAAGSTDTEAADSTTIGSRSGDAESGSAAPPGEETPASVEPTHDEQEGPGEVVQKAPTPEGSRTDESRTDESTTDEVTPVEQRVDDTADAPTAAIERGRMSSEDRDKFYERNARPRGRERGKAAAATAAAGAAAATASAGAQDAADDESATQTRRLDTTDAPDERARGSRRRKKGRADTEVATDEQTRDGHADETRDEELDRLRKASRRGTLDLGLLILRVAVGVIAMAHGCQKLFGWWGGPKLGGFTDMLINSQNTSIGFTHDAARPLAIIGALSETLGGLMLILGLLTPIAGSAILGVMIIATAYKATLAGGLWFFATDPDGRGGGVEYEMFLGVVAAVIILTGPGRYSLDFKRGWARRPFIGSIAWLVIGVAAAVVIWMLFNGTNPVHSPGNPSS
ncbi:hypothetical protein GCM10027169_13530 [Gordonia jinhuaensis]|uniref:DoxX family membrane protein n=1 Tax=Gordonia jinhuaensis TaxID=1517702 RepID=UPI001E360C79|nr:DoxX family membrane protein [Gordonia jinhuaensis]